MTKMLQRAVAEAARLSEDEQDALAARILAEIDDERGWDRAFAATTDEQWSRLADLARREANEDGSTSLDEFLDGQRG